MESAAALLDDLAAILERVRRERPLVHIISNLVSMGDVANVTLAIGARPVMAHAAEEVAEITRSAAALVLNLGTPSQERVEAMLAAGRAANATQIPIVFDPVGVGASPFRRDSASRLMQALRLAVVRGNADEIAVLGGLAAAGPGVDAMPSGYDRPRVVKALGKTHGAVIVATGATDYVSDGARLATVENGHPLLQAITGAGDMLDALIGASAGVEQDGLRAAASGLVWLGIAAERAAAQSSGIGSFRVALFDALGSLDPDMLRRQAKITLTKDP